LFTEEYITTDVLVVGGGIAGARAAIASAANSADVTLITKGIYASGTSVGPVVCAAAGPWTTPQDSRDLHFEGIVVSGRRFLCDQEHARVLVDEAPQRLLELESFGHLWDRDAAGQIAPYPEFSEEIRLPEDPDRYYQNRFVSSIREGMYFGYTGRNVLDVLKAESLRRGVRVIPETTAIRLLTRNGRVVGAVALDYLHGRWLVIRAGAVILATGSIAQIWYPWGLASREMTGDGLAMAYHAGAVISDLELMMTAYLPSVTPAWSGRHKLLQSVIEVAPGFRPEYLIRWVNAHNEEFLKNYAPAIPRTYEELYLKVIRGVQTEIDEGRGPLYMDYRSLHREFLEKVAPFILRMMDRLGRDEGEYMLEVGPNPMWSFGGIRINTRGESAVPGLYACADAANCIKDGLGAAVACGVTTCLVSGARAGEYAAGYAAAASPVEPESKQFAAVKAAAADWQGRRQGSSPLQIKLAIGEVMRRHMHLKHETGMKLARDKLAAIRREMLPEMMVSTMSGSFNNEIVEAFEVGAMLDVAEMMVAASLERKESRRHMFIREDYPRRDDANWLRHINIKKRGEVMALDTSPVAFPYLRPDATGLRPLR